MLYEKNILFLYARRRVFFIRRLKEQLALFGFSAKIFFADSDGYDPMRFFTDGLVYLPPVADRDFCNRLLDIVEQKQISMIVPWLDPDISALAEMRQKLSDLGCIVAAPQNDVIRLFNDKLQNSEWLYARNLPHPQTLLADSRLDAGAVIVQLGLPVIAKPRFGQGSMGISYFHDQAELQSWLSKNKADYILQQVVTGQEFTVDICQKGHELYCICPRIRIKTRGGEVLIAKTRLDADVLALARRIAEQIEITGIYNFQVIKGPHGLAIIEFNPRFGGGSDLTIAAGGNIPAYMLDLFYCADSSMTPQVASIQDNLVMTRYHDAHFFVDDTSTSTSGT